MPPPKTLPHASGSLTPHAPRPPGMSHNYAEVKIAQGMGQLLWSCDAALAVHRRRWVHTSPEGLEMVYMLGLKSISLDAVLKFIPDMYFVPKPKKAKKPAAKKPASSAYRDFVDCPVVFPKIIKKKTPFKKEDGPKSMSELIEHEIKNEPANSPVIACRKWKGKGRTQPPGKTKK